VSGAVFTCDEVEGAVSVVILSTRKPIEGVTKDANKKPTIFKLYDFTKTGK